MNSLDWLSLTDYFRHQYDSGRTSPRRGESEVETEKRQKIKLLTPEEAAKRLAVSPETVKKWLRMGKLNGVKVSVLWRVREEDLEYFIQIRTAPILQPGGDRK
ncbi:MAG: helix-turn-helix domain-containing protein [Firmicutes bacterium]|nr:helix-turn-helix domain-containing protein [Bacillota bacterium]